MNITQCICGFEQLEGLNAVIILSDEYGFLLSAAIAVSMYLASQVARVFTCVSQTFLGADPSWDKEITMVPHILDHVNLDCPDHK